MQGPIQESDFLEILRVGVRRTVKFMGLLNEFHGGPAKTEYILTTDIARAFLARHFEVRVEYLNRHFLNAMTRRRDWQPRQEFGKMRTDVAVVEAGIIPRAIVEVKIGVGGTLTLIKEDLTKIASTMECMKTQVAANVRAASVFQVHVRGRANDLTIHRLMVKVNRIEAKLEAALKNFAMDWPDFTFRLVSLQDQRTGFVATEILQEDDGTQSMGQNGHATRYYAILISSNRRRKKAFTFRERLYGD
tara:strand:- start:2157 stop:2897 length:741 start_codon:yes stop_codon:yes gene_type:complete